LSMVSLPGTRVATQLVAFDYPEEEKPKISGADIRRAQEAIRAGGPWRFDQRSVKEPWVGEPIAQTLGVDTSGMLAKRMVVGLITDWLSVGLLKRVEGKNDRRETKLYIEVGKEAVVEGLRGEKEGQNE